MSKEGRAKASGPKKRRVSHVAAGGHTAQIAAAERPQCELHAYAECALGAAIEREDAIYELDHAAKSHQTVTAISKRAVDTSEGERCEGAQLQKSLQDHIAQLQEVNKQLVVTSVNAQILAEQLQEAKAQMAHRAHHDFLTNLPNRLLLEERLTQAVTLASRHEAKIALLFLDLDRFKHINDSLGHSVGDMLLKSVAQRLVASIRSSDTVCRQGGDEFIVLLSEVAHMDDLVARIQKLHDVITQPYSIAERTLQIGASIGISLYPEDGVDNDTLIRHSDAAMYSAKENGRNGYAFFDKAMNDRSVARHGMETGLDEALTCRQLVLHYQAQVDLASGRINGAEVLIRWHHPVDGLRLPEKFVGIAEDCGMILSIGRWVLSEACTQAALWRNEGLALDVIAVNVSTVEFESANFVGYVMRALKETGLPPHCLELELTESVMMRNTDLTIQKLAALRAIGIRIAVDDFGTGYSSLLYLKRFPINTVKIGRSFVKDISTHGADNIVIDAVITIANGLGHQVVAGGVENEEQLAFLRERRCSRGQGFYLSVPMEAATFTDLLRKTTS